MYNKYNKVCSNNHETKFGDCPIFSTKHESTVLKIDYVQYIGHYGYDNSYCEINLKFGQLRSPTCTVHENFENQIKCY